MNTDEPLLTSLIDTLTGRGVCFALYRLPWQEELHLVWQEDAVPYIIPHIEDLNDIPGMTEELIRELDPIEEENDLVFNPNALPGMKSY